MDEWQEMKIPDFYRQSLRYYMIFSSKLLENYTLAPSLMEELEAVNPGLRLGTTSDLTEGILDVRIRKCGRILWTYILSPRRRKETGKNGLATWLLTLSQQIPIYLSILIRSKSIPGITSPNTLASQELSSYLTKTVLPGMELGLNHSSKSLDKTNG